MRPTPISRGSLLACVTLTVIAIPLAAEDDLRQGDPSSHSSVIRLGEIEPATDDILPVDYAEDEDFGPEAGDFEPPPSPYSLPVNEAALQQGEGYLSQRLSNLESEFHQFQNGFMSGQLAPGRLRSTDIRPLPPPTKPPTFPNVKVTGFFQADAAWFAQDTANIEQFGNIPDDRGFRRARLAAVGDVTENVSYMMEFDFAFPGRPSFMDVWLDVHEIPWIGNVRVGQWRQPFGLDELTSVRELTFLERPLGFTFAPFRQTGIGFHNTYADDRITAAASVFGFPTDGFGDSLGDRGYGTAERITMLPIYADEGRFLLHVAVDHAFTKPNQAGWFYRNTPEYGGPFVTPSGNVGSVPFFVNTGVLAFDTSNLLNAEWAGVWNSFHWQSELRFAVVDIAGQSITLPSAYVQAAYILTGEVRPYNKIAGVLGRIKPDRPWTRSGGCGAWEVAARFSYINLNPARPFGTPVDATPPFGGEESDLTVGLNWYLNSFTKFQFNYIRADLNRAGVNSNADVVAFRAQLDF